MLALLTVLATAVGGGNDPSSQQPTYAIVNVSVIPMDRERVLADQTVVVRGDKIVAMGPARSTQVPAGAVRIEGKGKYLIPGLAEMHGHTPPGQAFSDSTMERILALFALNGVTTVRGMLGDPRHLPYRDKAARGEILSPTIYLSGPSLNGNSVKTGRDAIDSVTKYAQAGYDLLKIHPGIKRGVFDTLAATAKAVGIRFAGHVPLDVGIERAIEAGYWTVDHFDGYIENLASPSATLTPQEVGFFGLGLMDRVDESRLAQLAKKTKAQGVWMVPTETLMRYVTGGYTIDELRSWPEMKYWSKAGLDAWARQTASFKGANEPPKAVRDRYIALRRKIITTFHKAGVGFLLGSDAPQIWNVPGFSIFRELEYLVDAGLTPYQALESGTRNVAVHFGTEAERGTVATGKRADLILLDGNPLTAISNVRKQAGVMVGGRWLPASEIAQRLTQLEAK